MSGNLIQDSTFLGSCPSNAGWCVTAASKIITPWQVAPCSSVPVAGCVVQDEANAELDVGIFNPINGVQNNIDLNPNGPSAIYQDVTFPAGYSGFNFAFDYAFNSNCGGQSGAFNVLVKNLATGQIQTTSCGATRVEFMSLLPSTSCGALVTNTKMNAIGSAPVNSACANGYSVVSAPSNNVTDASACGVPSSTVTDIEQALTNDTPLIGNYMGNTVGINFTFTNYGQAVNFTKQIACMPSSAIWVKTNNKCMLNTIYDVTQPCFQKNTNAFNASIYMKASLNGLTYGDQYPINFSFSGNALKASTSGAVSTNAANFTVNNLEYTVSTGILTFQIVPSLPSNLQFVSMTGLMVSGNGPTVKGPLDASNSFTTTYACPATTATFSYQSTAQMCLTVPGVSGCQPVFQHFGVTFSVSPQCTFSYAITSNLVQASLYDVTASSANLFQKDVWDLTLSSPVLGNGGYLINVQGVTIGDGSGAFIPVDSSCWSTLSKTKTAGTSVFEFTALALGSSTKSYKDLPSSYKFLCTGNQLNPFLINNAAALYTFNFDLVFTPSGSARRDGDALNGASNKGAATIEVAVDTSAKDALGSGAKGLSAAAALVASVVLLF
ncbi:hypothetical protein BC830DRAFT_881696 [Chytriomyces sp. MP71]|nr:hypothetical protein BC830DRAFT_881696 [Chytriomyces sp. MP71]